mgnify:FL=1
MMIFQKANHKKKNSIKKQWNSKNMKIKFFRTSAKILAAAIFLASCQTTYIPENDFDVAPEFFYQNEWNKTLLEAVRNNNYNLAKECLEKKASTGVYDLLGQTALMYACWNGNFQMVKLLCEWQNKVLWFKKSPEAKINRLSLYNYNALFCAAYKGDVEIMNYLMGKCAEFYGREDSNGENILHKLAKSNSPQAIQNFIEQNSKSQRGKNLLLQMSLKKDKNGCTPFFHAVAKGNVEAASLLLSLDETKAVLNEGSNNGYFPLYMAFENRNIEMFHFLMTQRELNINCPTPDKAENSEYKRMDSKTFSIESSSASLLSKQGDPNKFQSIYNNRVLWQESDFAGSPLLYDEETRKLFSEFYNKVCDRNCTVYDLKEIKNQLGLHISGASINQNQEKDVLLQAADTERPLQEKIEVLKYLLDCGISSSTAQVESEQIIPYTIARLNSTKNKDYLEIMKFLFENYTKYKNLYRITFGFKGSDENEPWKMILSSEFIRKNLSWQELEKILSLINFATEFSQTYRAEVFVYSIAGGANGIKKDFEYKEKLFDYFFSNLNSELNITQTHIPITTWLYQQKFYYGVEKILKEPNVAEIQNVKSACSTTSLDTFKDILEKDLTSSDEEIKSHAKKFLDMYNALYPEDVKAKNSRARAKTTTKQTKDSDSL